MTTAGASADLHDFNNATDASCVNNVGPPVNLLQVVDGSFYGVNPAYGPNGNGSIYKLTAAGVFSAFLFPNPPVDGQLPSSTLIQNTNGVVYGTTPGGGGGSGGCPNTCQGTFFGVATGDAPFVNLEPTQTTGNVGASVGMFGQGFSGASVVKFGGVAATSVTLSGANYLTAVVPSGAHTGAVTVTTGGTTLTSPQTFKVLPTIKSFTPTSGPVGTAVTITGTGLTQTTKVTFGGVAATNVTVNSDTQVKADVPTGAKTGKIGITTKGGKVTSKTSFSVT
jgi:IPT/TIG domain